MHPVTRHIFLSPLDTCRNWRRKKERKRRNDWSWREKGEREIRSESARGSDGTARKRRKGRERGTRSGNETEIATVNGRGSENASGRRNESGRGNERGAETPVKTAAGPESAPEKRRNETGKKMKKMCMNDGDWREG